MIVNNDYIASFAISEIFSDSVAKVSERERETFSFIIFPAQYCCGCNSFAGDLQTIVLS